MEGPSAEVLDLFAVPDDVSPVPGRRGGRVRAGDLLLTPGRDERVAAWLSPVLAHLAVRLDDNPERRRRDLRVATPVPARDGSWVVEGWGASRHDPDAVPCRDADVVLAAGQLLHAQLAAAIRRRPPGLSGRTDRDAWAEGLAFGPAHALLAAAAGTPAAGAVRLAERRLDARILGPDQLVHCDLADSVVLDGRGAPLITDVVPTWRPLVWAEAVCVLDLVVADRAPWEVLDGWRKGVRRQAMLRAVCWGALGDGGAGPAYERVVESVGST